MNRILDGKKIIFGLMFLLTFVNNIFYPGLAAVSVAAAALLIAAYMISGPGIQKFLYFSILIYSFMAIAFVLPLGSRYGVHYFYILLFIYMVIYLYKLIGDKGIGEVFKGFITNKYSLFIGIFLLYAIITILFADDKKNVVAAFITYSVMFSLVFVNINENSKVDGLRLTAKFMVYLYTVILAIGTLEIFNIRLGIRTHYLDAGPDAVNAANAAYISRIPITFFYNQNNYAVLLVVAMILLMVAYVYETKKARKRWILLLLFFTQLNVIFTASRTAWITIYIALGFYFVISFFLKNRDLRKLAVRFTVVVTTVFIVFSAVPYSAKYYGKFNATPILRALNIVGDSFGEDEQVEEKKIKIGGEGADSERITLVYDVFNGVFAQKNLLGFGAGNTENFLRSIDNTNGVYNVHFYWFEILGDFGVPIFLYTIYIYLRLLMDLVKTYKRSEGSRNISKYSIMMVGSLFAMVFLAIAPSSLIAYVPFWVILGICGAVVNNKMAEGRSA